MNVHKMYYYKISFYYFLIVLKNTLNSKFLLSKILITKNYIENFIFYGHFF
jgi:hypothetical protein